MRSLRHIVEAGASVMIITATVTEAAAAHSVAAALFGEVALLATGEDREVTAAWDAAQAGGRILVGTPRVAAWQVARLAMCVVIEEGRRAMKDRQTPTLHVRDLILTRARLEGFSAVFAGPTPSVETLAAGAEIITGSRRSWALVEVVDRSEDPPGAGFLSERALAALRLSMGRDGRSFVFTHRRASDSSTRCSACRTLRRCLRCGSNAGRRTTCARCGASLGACANCGHDTFESLGTVPEQLVALVNRALGAGSAGLAGTDAPIEVGTERDLAGEGGFDLVIATDVDGLALGRDYRASEEALRILARLGNLVASGPGRRMMLQTSSPESALVDTLRSGDPIPYLEGVLAVRAREGLPPSTEMLAVELRGIDDAQEADEALRAAGAPGLMGPATGDDGFRWLVQGDLTRFRVKLRSLVRSWRDREVVVRIDADPIDL
jgi:primosomal protein N' (replication factor Y)